MTWVYVYFKIIDHENLIIEQIHAMHKTIEQLSGVKCRLQRKLDDNQTWMEVYAGNKSKYEFKFLLKAMEREFDIPSLIANRHYEFFEEH